MSITKDVPVPTSYRRLHESKTLFNIHDRLMFVWVLLIAACGFTMIFMGNAGIRNMIYFLAVICIYGGIAVVTGKDVQTLDRNYRYILLSSKIILSKNTTKKYTVSLDDLKKIVPIETVEDTGLIRYPSGTSGIIILYVPPRTAEHDQDSHSLKMKNVINSLYGSFTFQFISNSIVYYQNPLLSATSEAMKETDIPKPVSTHLYSLYEEALAQKESIDVEFTLLVTLPAATTTAEAEQLRAAFIPSVLKSFKRADVYARVVEERNEVIQILRGQLC